MAMQLRCRCGRLRGEVDIERAYTRATCHCRHCQAFARFLGATWVLDAQGGTDIVPMAPTGVCFTAGQEHLACLSLSRKGLLRWYAACCRTPLANTPRDAGIFYVGVLAPVLAVAPDALDLELGPRDHVVLNTASATGPVRRTPLAFLLAGLEIFAHVAMAKLRRRRDTTFFDAEGQPIRPPQVLTPEQRASAGLGGA